MRTDTDIGVKKPPSSDGIESGWVLIDDGEGPDSSSSVTLDIP